MCGDAPAQQSTESTEQVMQSTIKNLPEFLSTVANEILPFAQSQLTAAQTISPEYNKLLTQLYADSAPILAQSGADVDRISRTQAADTDLEILRGSGGQLAKEGQEIDRLLNPEFYKTREATSAGLEQLLSSINLDDANPEAERLVNQENVRSGNAATPSATNTVSNALSFGNEMQKRRDSLGAALSTATNFLQPSQGQFNPVTTALNRPTTNTGVSEFAGVEKAGSEALSAGSSILGTATSLETQENDINSNTRDTLDRMNEVTASL